MNERSVEGESRAEAVAAYRDALQEIATRPVYELNPDGDDQAAATMQLIAREALGGEPKPFAKCQPEELAMPNMPEADHPDRKPAQTDEQIADDPVADALSDHGEPCDEPGPGGCVCTRTAGHSGEHVAVVDRWPEVAERCPTCGSDDSETCCIGNPNGHVWDGTDGCCEDAFHTSPATQPEGEGQDEGARVAEAVVAEIDKAYARGYNDGVQAEDRGRALCPRCFGDGCPDCGGSGFRAPAHPTPQPVSSEADRARVLGPFGPFDRSSVERVVADAETLDRLTRGTEGSDRG